MDCWAGWMGAWVGPSGAGKASLLHIAGLLEAPDAGQVVISGRDCVALRDGLRTAVRRRELGFVYQFHNLLPEFSALENVVLPQLIAGVPRRSAEKFSQYLLERMGLGPRATHRPAELRSEEHTSELQSLMRISYAVFCLKKKKDTHRHHHQSE